MLMEMWHTQKRYPRGETFYTQCTASKTGSLWRSPTDFLKSL